MPKLVEGKPAKTANQINWWLDINEAGDTVHLVAKHCDDVSDQRVIQIQIVDGKLVICQQALAAFNLCKAFGIEQKQRPRIFDYDKLMLRLMKRKEK